MFHRISVVITPYSNFLLENMKILSAIYLNCKISLRDDWISKINADQDVEEGKVALQKKSQ